MSDSSRERPNKCSAEGCEFSTTDPGSLTRHRKKRHGYEPKGDSFGSHSTAEPRKAARKRRRNTPYATTSSPSMSARSVSTDPSSPTSSILLSDDHTGEGKNAPAAHSTELITKRAQVNDSKLAPNPRPENTPLNSELSTASEAPTAEHPQLPVPKQGRLYAVDAAAQLVSEVFLSEEVLDNFLARFNDWQSPASSLPTPMVSYTVGNVPSPTTLPPYAVHDAYIPTPAAVPPYTVNNAPLPTSASLLQYAVDNACIPIPASLPPYAVDDAYPPIPASLPPYYNAPIPAPTFLPPYTVNNASPSASQPPYEVQSIVDHASYEYCYTTEAVSFDAQWSQPDLATPDMGAYPRAVYPQDVNQDYCYTTHAGTNDFAMHGLYVN